MRQAALSALVLLLAGCGWLARPPQNPPPVEQPPRPARGEPVSYQREIQPLLARRCVSCHACYDAPCQLKLTAWEGVDRGASKDQVYGVSRLLETTPTRLFEDAADTVEWRSLGFHDVLGATPATRAGELNNGLLARLLALKMRQPGPVAGTLPAERFDFDINRSMSCPSSTEFSGYAANHPEWGMPYGLPELAPAERTLLLQWLDQGAPGEARPPPGAAERARIASWEAFLNGDSAKARLMSRYIYEHLFLGHLHFGDSRPLRFFRLVRSATPPGQPVRRIATRRPHDDPGVPRVWYRIVPDDEVVVAKTHLPYRLDAARMARWRELFLAADYTVDALPGYSAAEIANPFLTFAAIPVASRYRFMLDEAAFTIMGFIKGPVCRGQVALNVINDHFWVFFADPENSGRTPDVDRFLSTQAENLALPAGWTNQRPLLFNWLAYSRAETRYLEARSRYLDAVLDGPLKLDLNLIWDGEQRNPNAALTVFRHLDSATVLQGLAGGRPKTAWVLTYPLLERVHYLLAANFDVFGTLGHQIESRLYMDFLRMEAEFNTLAYLPREQREKVRNFWYRQASESEKNFVYGRKAWLAHETHVPYRTNDPYRELFDLLKARLTPATGERHSMSTIRDPVLRRDLERLAGLSGPSLSWLPENAVLRIARPDDPPLFISLLRNTGHLNVSQIFNEEGRLAPEDNTLSVVPGIVGAYPNAFYRLRAHELPALGEAIAGLASEADYRRLADRFAVRRTAPDFWKLSDELHDAYARLAPIEAGILDYNRLENR
ncbi:MAG: fatty acid cis/trans isomerase [Dechloromonas sp.]|nr:MAG: fatty acid cis/trans isomerase [Dechloromonas sp.]